MQPLVVAKEFDFAEKPGKAQLSLEDALVLLERMHDLTIDFESTHDRERCEHCRRLALEILKGLSDDRRRTVLSRSPDLKILEGYDCGYRQDVAISLAKLEQCRMSGLLFLNSLVDRLGLAPQLQNVLEAHVVVVSRATADLAFGKDTKLDSCTANALLGALGKHLQPLKDKADRRRLVAEMAAADLSDNERTMGLRYLLHGQKALFRYTGTLWISGYEQSSAWRKIWQHLAQDEDLNVLPRDLVGGLPTNKWNQLGIKEIKPQEIISELRIVETNMLDGELFSAEEREAVLTELEGEEQLWKDLPFHETVDGQLVRIVPESTYLESDIRLEEELCRQVHIVKRSGNNLVARQQREWILPITASAVINIASQHPNPSMFWRQILAHLNTVTINGCLELLRKIAWLVDVQGESLKPEDVIHLGPIQDDADRLLALTRGAYTSPQNLHRDIQAHPSFPLLAEHCFSTQKEGIEKLALLLGETEEYHIGKVRIDAAEIERAASVCARFPLEFGLPGWRLLANVIPSFPVGYVELLLEEMLQPISPDKLFKVLRWLQKEYEDSSSSGRQDTLTAFNGHLAALVDMGGAQASLSQLSLLNREGQWRPGRELCAEAEGIADSHLLDDKQKRVLQQVIHFADRQQAKKQASLPRRRDLQLEIDKSAPVLENFFFDWEGLVPPEIICAFLSLLGDDPGVLKLADKYRGRHSVKWVRDNIPWTVHFRQDRDGRQEWIYGLDLKVSFR